MASSFVGMLGTMLAPNPTALPPASAVPCDVDQLCAATQVNDEKEEQIRASEVKKTAKHGKRGNAAIFQSDDNDATTIAGRPLNEGTGDIEGIRDNATTFPQEQKSEIKSSTGNSVYTSSTNNDAETRVDCEDVWDPEDEMGNGYDRFINRSYETFPEGTPRLAAFQSSSKDLTIFRRNTRLFCRLLQRKQGRLTILEKEIDNLDLEDSLSVDMKYRLARNDWQKGWDRTQEDLLDKAEAGLVEYSDLLLRFNKLCSLNPAPTRDHRHLFNWIFGTKPLDAGHYDFILHHDDFVSVSDMEGSRSGLDEVIESGLSRWPAWPLKHFMGKVESPEDSNVHFFPRRKIVLLTKLLALCIAVTTLLIPIFIFSMMDLNKRMMLIIALVFVLFFAAVICLFVGASIETMFIGTCTYAAVLVTFLANVQSHLTS